jgi:hypothetical protein
MDSKLSLLSEDSLSNNFSLRHTEPNKKLKISFYTTISFLLPLNKQCIAIINRTTVEVFLKSIMNS